MLAVPDAPAAVAWYANALGAVRLWDLGSVVGMDLDGAPFFLAEPEDNKWATPGSRSLLLCGRWTRIQQQRLQRSNR